MKTLVIVESPAKAGTISKILGKDYDVTSSFGHIRDLAKDGEGNTGVEVENKYKPHYIIPESKKKVVADLKRMMKKYDRVLLATDEDREGEAISWHLYEVLKLTKKNSKRITFTEITKSAIEESLKNPRDVDIDLVNAQQARRILDRLVGFKLTSLLWKKVRAQLSAGRVQSVAVRIVVDKEQEIHDFKPEKYFKVTGVFKSTKDTLPAELSAKLHSKSEAEKFLEECKKADFTVKSVEKKPSKRRPSPPFTTSTLQQLASHKLGFSVSRTMSTAQRLYEAGHITYMRTDSISLSGTAINNIGSFVKKEFGEKYSQSRQFKTKSKSSQEAHEAIRPTHIEKKQVSTNRDQQKLYDLIRSRALASQMADAEVEKTTILINISTSKKHFISKGEIVTFDGFLKAYSGTKYYAQDDSILPDLHEGDNLEPVTINALERHSKPPSRYSEATLVKKLEELGIGRPSTYAPTIAKITSPTRGYITKETRDGIPTDYILLTLSKGTVSETVQQEIAGAQKNKLFASDMGKVVTDFLKEHFEDIMDYAFTAEVEDTLDEIAEGKKDWIKALDSYYKPFTKILDKTLETANRATGERKLGKDPKSGKTVIVRISKYGPVVQIGTEDELKDDEKPQYAQMMREQSLEEITLEEALKLFDLPKTITQYKGVDVVIGRGRFGPYVKYDATYASIPRDINPFAITKEQALEVLKAKLKEQAPIAEYEGKPITRGKGRFGPYIKWDNTFVSITKKSGIDFDNIPEKEAIELVKDKIKKDKEKIIHTWDDGKITLQKGRWGPMFRVQGKRGFIAVPKKGEEKMSPDDLKKLDDKEIKKLLKVK